MNLNQTVLTVAPTWLWVSFSLGVLSLLIIDMSLFGKNSQGISRKKALIESILWITVALIFNLWFGSRFGKELGLEFLTGYLVEKSLSVDNLFVILLIFNSFRIPNKFQHRILFYGVLGAIILRALFIILGAKLLHHFHWILYVFGAVLVFTAIKFLKDNEDEESEKLKENQVVIWLKRLIPTTSTFKDDQFFIKEHGVRKATPLFVALVVVEMTDLIFAVDSIPAVFAVTQDAFVAFASNILAILGLRALYFVLADWVNKLRYLKPGLAVILGFIGAKMLIVDFVKIPNWVSLLVVFSVLITASLGSWYVSRSQEKKRKKH
ncbi:MAG: TerC family protein [Bdellovibrionales bacterium]|nr:TerC family protein [Bdellovibrionales bacterium]